VGKLSEASGACRGLYCSPCFIRISSELHLYFHRFSQSGDDEQKYFKIELFDETEVTKGSDRKMYYNVEPFHLKFLFIPDVLQIFLPLKIWLHN
jgi:hypothetical protein